MTEEAECFRNILMVTDRGYGLDLEAMIQCPKCGFIGTKMVEPSDNVSPLQCPECGFRGSMDGAIDEIREAPTLSFGQVLEALKADPFRRFARKGWNDNGQYISMQVPGFPSKITRPYLYIKTVNGELIPWAASQTDMLSDDWYEVKG